MTRYTSPGGNRQPYIYEEKGTAKICRRKLPSFSLWLFSCQNGRKEPHPCSVKKATEGDAEGPLFQTLMKNRGGYPSVKRGILMVKLDLPTSPQKEKKKFPGEGGGVVNRRDFSTGFEIFRSQIPLSPVWLAFTVRPFPFDMVIIPFGAPKHWN